MTLYNEIDPFAAGWLRALIAAGHVSPGDVNTTSIVDLRGSDCAPTTHLFAGIGGWDYALQLAGWPATVPVWTGSCPCQPFSLAGSGRGTDDERHLWPDMRRLVDECRPAIVFGEQVASADGRHWLAAVRADLEAMGYAVGAADLCAAGVGAPHIRQRLYWGAVRVDDAASAGRRWRESRRGGEPRGPVRAGDRVGDADSTRPPRRPLLPERRAEGDPRTPGVGGDRMGDADRERRDGLDALHVARADVHEAARRGAWHDAELVECDDPVKGRVWRPAQPGAFPLANGVSGGVGRLRGYGNAIVPQTGAAFVTAFMASL